MEAFWGKYYWEQNESSDRIIGPESVDWQPSPLGPWLETVTTHFVQEPGAPQEESRDQSQCSSMIACDSGLFTLLALASTFCGIRWRTRCRLFTFRALLATHVAR